MGRARLPWLALAERRCSQRRGEDEAAFSALPLCLCLTCGHFSACLLPAPEEKIPEFLYFYLSTLKLRDAFPVG